MTVCIALFLSSLLPFVSFAGEKGLTMATTTSTDNTGLLDKLIPEFEKETGISLKWTATGTGKALALGRRCDVDVLLVHAPPAEQKFIDNGFGKTRREVMYNDFVIIGPAGDPARIKGKSIDEALNTILESKSTFTSRGDDSGTNKKELLLWKKAGIATPDKEAWYLQTGQGMLSTILITEEKKAYTMTDRGTYIKYQDQRAGSPSLVVLVEGDAILLNQYSVLTLSPANCPDVNHGLAKLFSDWMAGKTAQNLIKKFKLLEKELFVPNAK